jgi:hypothetical protein
MPVRPWQVWDCQFSRMAVSAVWKPIPGVIIGERFTRARNSVRISYALCSIFISGRDVILSSGDDHYLVPRRLFGAFSERVGHVSSGQPGVDLHSPHGSSGWLWVLSGETVALGAARRFAGDR